MATLNIKGFPEDLYKILSDRADKDRRSLSQEVIYLLSIALEKTDKPSILELRGLGKNAWKGISTSKHINKERQSWD